MAALLFGASVFAFSQIGFEGRLTRDKGNLLYTGQQMVKGVPPYVSLFDHTGPLSPLIAGAVLITLNPLGVDNVFAVRLVFCVISALAVVALYWLATTLSGYRSVGLLAAIVFIGLEGFARDAGSGPRAKTPMVLFEILCLLFAAHRRWFLAGLFGSLAFLAWQPAGVYAVTTVAVSGLQDGSGRRSNLTRAIAGTLLPIVAVCGYFAYKNAFVELVNSAVLFNVNYIERVPTTLIQHLANPIAAVYRSYPLGVLPMVLGFLAIAPVYAWRLRENDGSISKLLATDRYSAFLISYAVIVIWSLVDFQGGPDLFPLLPYLAIGFGGVLHLGLSRIMDSLQPGPALRRAMLAVVCVILLMTEAGYYRKTREQGLQEQRQSAKQIEDEFGHDFTLISISSPEILVLLNKTNPNRYLSIASGVDNLIDATEPGGFEGWLRQLVAYEAPVIAIGPVTGRRTEILMNWLNAHFEERKVGSWTLYVTEHRDAPPS
ncbi:MAG TPA: DolP-mannose mannosyltransferase [Blastocatellia bacterium]|nr:DolP-mannose mannosyltransferase [Blastocatellia bacterium]